MTISLKQRSQQALGRESRAQSQSSAILHQLQKLLQGGSKELVLKQDLPIRNALRQCLFHYKFSVPATLQADLAEQEVTDALASVGLIGRDVKLPENWMRSDYGLLLFVDENLETWIASPNEGGYQFRNSVGETCNSDDVLREGLLSFAVYPSLPAKPIGLWQWVTFGSTWVRRELSLFVVMTLLVSLFAMLLPVLTATIVNDVVPNSDFGLLGQLVLLLVLVVLFQGAADYFRAWLELRMRTKNGLILQAALIDRVIALASAAKQSATRLAMQVQFAESLRSGLSSSLMSGFTGVSYFLSAVVIMFVYQPVGAAVILFSAVLILSILALISWSALKVLREGQLQDVNSADLLYDIMSNLTIIRSFGLERQFFSNWSESYALSRQKMLQSRQRTRVAAALESSWSMLLMGLGYGAIAISGVQASEQGEFVSFATALSSAFVGLNLMASALQSAAQTLPYRATADALLKFQPPAPAYRVTPKLKGAIHLSHVRYQYQKDSPAVLRDIDLKIEAGEYVGIVGASGSGKSTLLKILLGLLKPQAGEVLFDGRAIEEMDSGALRRQVGVVMQDQSLIPGSLYDNIAGLHPLSMDEVWNAAELAAIADDIRALPMGMYTMVNDANDVFSGGQIQRIVLARALASTAPVLILDEATSALDNATQDSVSSNLNELDNTRIVIAHRLSTVRHCDRILVMNRGQFVQSGTWQQLASEEGLFREFLHLEKELH